MNPKKLIDLKVIETVTISPDSARLPRVNRRIPFSACELVHVACALSPIRGGDPKSLYPDALGLLEEGIKFLEQQEKHRGCRVFAMHAVPPTPEQKYTVATLERMGHQEVAFNWLLTPIESAKGHSQSKKPIVRLGSITTQKALCKMIRKALPQEADEIIRNKKVSLRQLQVLEHCIETKIRQRNSLVAKRRKNSRA